jgi:alkylation response protein AidB-like acyl-CoA dehydrogenase
MDFHLMTRKRLMKEAVREFVVSECDPAAPLELARKKQFSWDIYKKAGQHGYLALYFPKELGGQGIALLDYCLMIEEIICYDNRVGMALAFGSGAARAILRFGTDEQKKKYLPKLPKEKPLPPLP